MATYQYENGDRVIVTNPSPLPAQSYEEGQILRVLEYDRDTDVVVCEGVGDLFGHEVAPYNGVIYNGSDTEYLRFVGEPAPVKERPDEAFLAALATEEGLAQESEELREMTARAHTLEQRLFEAEQKFDVVAAPAHYTNSGIQPIEFMADKLPAYGDGFLAYCAGNVIKYVARAPHKHETPLEDLKKARQYLDFAIEHLEGKE